MSTTPGPPAGGGWATSWVSTGLSSPGQTVTHDLILWVALTVNTGSEPGPMNTDWQAVVGGSGAAPDDGTYTTVTDETGDLPHSRRLDGGTNITLDTSVA